MPVEVTGTPVVWQGRPAILILVKDVSRYISREEELKQRVIELQAEWQANSEALKLHMDELATQKNNLDLTHLKVPLFGKRIAPPAASSQPMQLHQGSASVRCHIASTKVLCDQILDTHTSSRVPRCI